MWLLLHSQEQSLGVYCSIIDKDLKHPLNYEDVRQIGSSCQWKFVCRYRYVYLLFNICLPTLCWDGPMKEDQTGLHGEDLFQHLNRLGLSSSIAWPWLSMDWAKPRCGRGDLSMWVWSKREVSSEFRGVLLGWWEEKSWINGSIVETMNKFPEIRMCQTTCKSIWQRQKPRH